MREIVGRILYFGNSERMSEAETACDFCDRVQIFAITDNYTAYVDDMNKFYNVVIVVGTDAARICKFMRINRSLLRDKAKIAILSAASPVSRAKILCSGYDDIFVESMPAVERRVRIEAILGRLTQVREAATLQSVLDLHLRHYAHEPLSGREMRLMSLLLAAKGRPVSGFRLAATSRPPRPPMSEKSLQVLVSVLRSKLKDHVVLEHHGSEGYSLHPVMPLVGTGGENSSTKLG